MMSLNDVAGPYPFEKIRFYLRERRILRFVTPSSSVLYSRQFAEIVIWAWGKMQSSESVSARLMELYWVLFVRFYYVIVKLTLGRPLVLGTGLGLQLLAP
jgi:hypothetical protein